MYVSLGQVKQHLLIEHNADDLYLLDLISVAESAMTKRLNLKNLEDAVGDNGMLSPTVIQSILLLIGTLYANRESVSYANVNEVPHTLEFLIGLDRNYDMPEGYRAGEKDDEKYF